MNDEIEKVAPKVQTSWEAQREKSLAEAKEKMGDLGADEQLKSIDGIRAEVAEYWDLSRWFTDAFDEAVLVFAGGAMPHTDIALTAEARQSVKQAEPEKFERFLELQKLRDQRGAVHQALANAAQASIVENGFYNKFAF